MLCGLHPFREMPVPAAMRGLLDRCGWCYEPSTALLCLKGRPPIGCTEKWFEITWEPAFQKNHRPVVRRGSCLLCGHRFQPGDPGFQCLRRAGRSGSRRKERRRVGAAAVGGFEPFSGRIHPFPSGSPLHAAGFGLMRFQQPGLPLVGNLHRSHQPSPVHVSGHVRVHVLGSWALTVIPAHAGIQKGRRYTLQGRVGSF